MRIVLFHGLHILQEQRVGYRWCHAHVTDHVIEVDLKIIIADMYL